jgi:DNA-binding FadR family transcriptional regulator
MLLGIEERSDMYLINSGLPIVEANMDAAVNDRRAILACVRVGDAEGAAAAAFAHADRIRSRWQRFYPGES